MSPTKRGGRCTALYAHCKYLFGLQEEWEDTPTLPVHSCKSVSAMATASSQQSLWHCLIGRLAVIYCYWYTAEPHLKTASDIKTTFVSKKKRSQSQVMFVRTQQSQNKTTSELRPCFFSPEWSLMYWEKDEMVLLTNICYSQRRLSL